MSRRCAFVLTVCVSLVAWAAFLPRAYTQNDWVFSWDSAAYIETAQSILAGHGLQQRAIHGLGDAIWEPMTWWPPGYSILIAAVVATTGISPHVAGLLISVLAGACGVLLVAYLSARLFDWPIAVTLSTGTVVMTGMLQISTQYMSDSLYFACAGASIVCLVCWSLAAEPRAWPLVAAGVLAGAAWTIRYVGITLIGVSLVFIVAHALWSPSRRIVRLTVVWALSVSVPFLPLAIRNIWSFGQLTPYSMPPSELTLKDNISQLASVLVTDFTGSATVASWLIDLTRLPLYAAALLALIWWGYRHAQRDGLVEALKARRVELFLTIYVATYCAMVIAARSTYRWGELIDRRHLAQIYWLVAIGAGMWGLSILRGMGLTPRAARNVVLAIFTVSAAFQTRTQAARLLPDPRRNLSLAAIVGADAAEYLAGSVRQDQIVLSTRADLLRLHCDINARKLPPVSQYDFLQPITLDDIQHQGGRGFLWGLVIEDRQGAERGEYDRLVKDLLQNYDKYADFERIDLGSPALILRYRRSEKSDAATALSSTPEDRAAAESSARRRRCMFVDLDRMDLPTWLSP